MDRLRFPLTETAEDSSQRAALYLLRLFPGCCIGGHLRCVMADLKHTRHNYIPCMSGFLGRLGAANKLDGESVTAIEAAILTGLALGAIFIWFYVFVVLRKRGNSEESADSDGAEIFPIEEWEEISAHELGEIEASIKGLIRVIIAAHRCEEPTNELLTAVKKNFAANVEYHFLVSKEHARSELDGWVKMFRTIAEIVLAKARSPRTAESLVLISSLTYSWRDTPYVFYQTETTNGKLATVAFRGDEIDEGIAKRYTRLPGWLAYSLANAILSDAPQRMTIEAPEFHELPEIDHDVIGSVGAKKEHHAGSG